MRLAILSTTKDSIGGVERFNAYLVALAHKKEYTVTVYSFDDLNAYEKRCVKGARSVGMGQPALGYFVGRAARRGGFDICVTNGLLGWNLTGAGIVNVQHGTFARAADRIDRGVHPVKFLIKKYIWGFFEGLAARRAQVCVAVSEETRESVKYYYRRADVRVITNAVDTVLFTTGDALAARRELSLSETAKILVFVGRFERAKGSDILTELQYHAASLGATLVVAETYPQEAVSALYRAADVFVLPSLHEGCSYALLEAMSSGVPFVAEPVGLVADLARQGMFPQCVVHEHTYAAYAKAISSLLALPAPERARLTHDVRDYIVNIHSLERFFEAYTNLFHELL